MSLKESATQKVRIGDSHLDIVTYTTKYKNFGIEKMIINYLNEIPPEDLKGLGKINIYHDTPDYFTRKISGGYYSKEQKVIAEIDIYLYRALPYILINEPFASLRNKIFFIMFGELFIASTLFHELGHHKYTDVIHKQYRDDEASEKDAEDYATKLLWKVFPFRYRYYSFFNELYRFLYKKRIKKTEKIRMKENNSMMPPAD